MKTNIYPQPFLHPDSSVHQRIYISLLVLSKDVHLPSALSLSKNVHSPSALSLSKDVHSWWEPSVLSKNVHSPSASDLSLSKDVHLRWESFFYQGTCIYPESSSVLSNDELHEELIAIHGVVQGLLTLRCVLICHLSRKNSVSHVEN